MSVINTSTPLVAVKIEDPSIPLPKKVESCAKNSLCGRAFLVGAAIFFATAPVITGIALLAIGSSQGDERLARVGGGLTVVYPFAFLLCCGSCFITTVATCGKKCISCSENTAGAHQIPEGGGGSGM